MRASIGLFLAFAASALAQEPQRLGFNPFEKAAVGDWMVLRREISLPNEKPLVHVMQRLVTKVTDDEVTVVTRELGSEDSAQEQVFQRKKAPELARLVFDNAELPVGDVEAKKEPVEVEPGKKVECQVSSFTVSDLNDPAAKTKCKVWAAAEVKVTGVVKLELQRPDATMTTKLLGWGSKDAASWGQTAEQVEAELKKKQ